MVQETIKDWVRIIIALYEHVGSVPRKRAAPLIIGCPTLEAAHLEIEQCVPFPIDDRHSNFWQVGIWISTDIEIVTPITRINDIV